MSSFFPSALLMIIAFTTPQVAYDELHEFIEIYNGGTDEVDIGNWRIISEAGGMHYSFP